MYTYSFNGAHDYILEENTCLDRTIDLLQSPESSTCLEMTDEEVGNDNLTCPFHFYLNRGVSLIHLPKAKNLEDMTWSCTLDASQICDGTQQCLTDECHCQDNHADVFYCADGSGCVTWASVCDDRQDCMDASDECFCPGYIGHVTNHLTGGKICVKNEWNCTIDQDLSAHNINTPEEIKQFGSDCVSNFPEGFIEMNPIELCLFEAWYEIHDIFRSAHNDRISEYCRVNCSHVSNFTDG